MERRGFTIVELLIVIVVIAILAAITIVAYNGIQNQAKSAALRSDLANASRAIEVAHVNSGVTQYPVTLPDTVSPSENVGLSLSEAGTSYCINAQTLTEPIERFYYSPSSGMASGTCPGAVIAGTERGMPSNVVNDTGFSDTTTNTNGWYFGRGGGSLAGATRDGQAGDPFPNRKVLVITNTTNANVTWAYLHGPPVRHTEIAAGQTYDVSYWVRRTAGTFTDTIGYIGAQNGSATDTSIPTVTSGGLVPSTTWTQMRRTTTATANGNSSHLLYLPMSSAMARNHNFTLEFQGFSITPN
ncbi:hypothetical protein CL689_05560 [Candidatus Saccharibacteria bacterium]|nr:hypothetical protein [Candidatus Saccharibacteria bacterium]|tara:strand:+ start:9600 stop:10496 length:897 start_codon:yes stop_codon:yes gene_type:complete